MTTNLIYGVMVGVLASSMVDHVFDQVKPKQRLIGSES